MQNCKPVSYREMVPFSSTVQLYGTDCRKIALMHCWSAEQVALRILEGTALTGTEDAPPVRLPDHQEEKRPDKMFDGGDGGGGWSCRCSG